MRIFRTQNIGTMWWVAVVEKYDENSENVQNNKVMRMMIMFRKAGQSGGQH